MEAMNRAMQEIQRLETIAKAEPSGDVDLSMSLLEQFQKLQSMADANPLKIDRSKNHPIVYKTMGETILQTDDAATWVKLVRAGMKLTKTLLDFYALQADAITREYGIQYPAFECQVAGFQRDQSIHRMNSSVQCIDIKKDKCASFILPPWIAKQEYHCRGVCCDAFEAAKQELKKSEKGDKSSPLPSSQSPMTTTTDADANTNNNSGVSIFLSGWWCWLVMVLTVQLLRGSCLDGC